MYVRTLAQIPVEAVSPEVLDILRKLWRERCSHGEMPDCVKFKAAFLVFHSKSHELADRLTVCDRNASPAARRRRPESKR